MPLLNFTNAIKNEKLTNVKIDSSVDFANLTSAFISGQGDGVNLFELSVMIISYLIILNTKLLL